VNASGLARYLEIFPQRPNLLARVDNGIGKRQVGLFCVDLFTEFSCEPVGRRLPQKLDGNASLPPEMLEQLDQLR